MSTRTTSGTRRRAVLYLAAGLLLMLPAAGAQAQVTNFDELMQVVAQFEGGLRDDVATAQCTTPDISEATATRPFEPVDDIACLEGPSPIVGSGWDISRACFAAYKAGPVVVGFFQGGMAGDGDGDGNPTTNGLQFDTKGVGPDEAYEVDLDSDFSGVSEFRFSVGDVDVGNLVTSERGTSTGNLCLAVMGGLASPAQARPETASTGCIGDFVGTYTTGTSGIGIPVVGEAATVSREVMIFADDITNLPEGRSLNPSRLRLTLQAGSREVGETCFEDTTTFVAVGASIDLEKDSSGVCSDREYRLSSSYVVTNDGLTDLEDVVLEDIVATSPGGLLTAAPECTCIGCDGSVTVTPTGGGSFSASLGALPASDFDAVSGDVFPAPSDVDCGDDGVIDPSCGSATVSCSWPGIPIGDLTDVRLDNEATVDGLVGDVSRASDDASDSVVVVRTPACEGPPPPPGGAMRKEHEGVGYDNQLSLTRSIPFGSTFAFGSNVDPTSTLDVDVREDFSAAGAVEVFGRPGVFANLPRIPPGKGLRPQRGTRSVFTWDMLVTGDVNDVSNFDVVCSVCAEKPWRTDGSKAQTFVPDVFDSPGDIGTDLVIENQAVMLRVNHICGPIHGGGSCGGTLSTSSTPGLIQAPSNVFGENFVTFMGCKETTVQVAPLSSGDPILPMDLLQVEITIPESERTQLYVDATSCEAAYITTTRKE